MPVVDIYCRVATHNKNTYVRLERQEVACRAYCETQGLEVGIVHHEVAAGTTYQNRRQMRHILSRCSEEAIQGVVVADRERVSRLPEQYTAFIAELQRYNATLYIVQGAPISLQP